MKKKKLAVLIVALAMVLTCVPGVSAAPDPDDEVFAEYPSGTGVIFDLRTPFGSPTPTYRTVTSKWNQPRNVNGSNPHMGVDLDTDEATAIFAPYDGWINFEDYGGTEDIGFEVDVNGNGKHDDVALWVMFSHLDSRYPEGHYKKGEQIGFSGMRNATGHHLHFGNTTPNHTRWYRNEPYYRHTSSWNAGKALDAYSLVEWTSNTASFYAYVMDDGTASAFSEVKLYYRTTNGGTWTEVAAPLTHSNYKYSYNFTGKVPPGTAVQWMFRLTRSGVTEKAFGPAKYYQPPANPNSSPLTYAYWTNIVS
ncbi:MAG: M23 family metallopeptidase [Oscillospiraceae bacterium]|nr:M23 family metallopeptidase [Oscillospiraceae bacterium]